jgi:hypothetical protein
MNRTVEASRRFAGDAASRPDRRHGSVTRDSQLLPLTEVAGHKQFEAPDPSAKRGRPLKTPLGLIPVPVRSMSTHSVACHRDGYMPRSM